MISLPFSQKSSKGHALAQSPRDPCLVCLFYLLHARAAHLALPHVYSGHDVCRSPRLVLPKAHWSLRTELDCDRGRGGGMSRSLIRECSHTHFVAHRSQRTQVPRSRSPPRRQSSQTRRGNVGGITARRSTRSLSLDSDVSRRRSSDGSSAPLRLGGGGAGDVNGTAASAAPADREGRSFNARRGRKASSRDGERAMACCDRMRRMDSLFLPQGAFPRLSRG